MTPFTAAPFPAEPTNGASFLRRALAGLTPGVVAIVVAILAARVLSASGDSFVVAANAGELLEWLASQYRAFPSLAIMVVPMLVGVVATANLGPQHGWQRVAALAAAVVLSAGAGVVLRVLYGAWLRGSVNFERALSMATYVWPRYALLGGLLAVIFELVRREVAAAQRTRQAEIGQAELEREMAEARLEVLRAQIEPHFLFNTLANVRRLYDRGDPDGRRMLDRLMRYLEVALPSMRDAASTLGRELELVEAYLDIQCIRMGRRLTYGVEAPREILGREVPPMMLLTLAENAVKHGVDRRSEGGRIQVTARADSGRLALCVADTGVGFGAGSGGGVGLANVRARLAAQFGDGAFLALENNEFGGATATIELPLATPATDRERAGSAGDPAIAGALP